MTSQTNKMKRERSPMPIVASSGLTVLHRTPFTEGYPELALPTRPVQQSQYCPWSPTRWNGRVVYPEQHIREVVYNRIIVVDSRKAYVYFASRSIAFSDASRPYELVAGSGKTILWYVLWQVRGFASCLCHQLARL